MTKFFEEGKFYKFASEAAKIEFTGNYRFATNTAIADYIGSGEFEVQIDTADGEGEKVYKIFVRGRAGFVDVAYIINDEYDERPFFVSQGYHAREFNFFVEA